MWLLALGLFWPVLPENLYGFPIAAARAITALGLAAMFALYAATLTLLLHAIVSLPARPAERQGEPASVDRRTFLARSGVAAVGGLLLGGFALDALIQALFGRSNLSYEGMTTQPPITYLTPTDKFYVVSKNVLDPDVALGDWALDVGGLVARPGRYDLASLEALPQETRVITLECIANGVDGRLLSTAMWRGVTLKFLLAAHGGVQTGASQVVFTSADGYQSSLPLSELLAVDTLLAWEMNGAPLPSRHGYPLRVVVPGHFGEQSPKWLTSIELVDHTFKGFYQQQGWYSGPVYTISRIDHPGTGDQLAGIWRGAWHPVGGGERGWWRHLAASGCAGGPLAAELGAVELGVDAHRARRLYAGRASHRWHRGAPNHPQARHGAERRHGPA